MIQQFLIPVLAAFIVITIQSNAANIYKFKHISYPENVCDKVFIEPLKYHHNTDTELIQGPYSQHIRMYNIRMGWQVELAKGKNAWEIVDHSGIMSVENIASIFDDALALGFGRVEYNVK